MNPGFDDSHDALMATLGLSRVIRIDEAGAELEFVADERHCHTVVQGGFVTAWLDAAMARAVAGATRGEAMCNTLEIKVAFYSPARLGETLLATAWVERLGRSTAFLEARLTGPDGAALAKATSTAKLGKLSSHSTT